MFYVLVFWTSLKDEKRYQPTLADTIRKETKNKPGTSGCGSFVVAFFQPATFIDRLHVYKWVMFHIYFVYKWCLAIILLIIQVWMNLNCYPCKFFVSFRFKLTLFICLDCYICPKPLLRNGPINKLKEERKYQVLAYPTNYILCCHFERFI